MLLTQKFPWHKYEIAELLTGVCVLGVTGRERESFCLCCQSGGSDFVTGSLLGAN